mgnify:CR=1 FL=1
MNEQDIIKKYKPMIVKLARTLSLDYMDDLVGVGYNALITSYNNHKNRKSKLPLNTYIYNKVKTAMRDELRRLLWFKRSKKGYSLTTLQEIVTNDSEELLINRDTYLQLCDIMKNNLTQREQEIMRQIYWNGLTLLEVASYLQLKESRVSQIHKDILKKLKDAYERENSTNLGTK